MQAMTVGRDLSMMGITTRNRDHDSQAQNSSVGRPADHGAVAVVVLEPHPRLGHPGPIDPPAGRPDRPSWPRPPPGGWCAPSRDSPAPPACRGRCRRAPWPWRRSTHSSTLTRNGSISCSRRAGDCRVPASRAPTQWATVLGEQPASSPASRKLRVRSNASSISMISSSDFTCFSSVAGCSSTLSTPGRSAPAVDPPGRRSIGKADSGGRHRAVLVAASVQFLGRLRSGSHGRRQ